MCLEKITTEEPLTAKKDIVVYKWLRKSIDVKELNDYFTENKNDNNLIPCTATIMGFDEVVKVSGFLFRNYDYFILHNNSTFRGVWPKVKPESCTTLYSWTLDSTVLNIILESGVIFTSDNYLETPYQLFPVELGKLYNTELWKSSDAVYDGLHSFATIKAAENDSTGNYVIVECIIPKGAEYYEGVFGKNKSYASNQLKYIKLCV